MTLEERVLPGPWIEIKWLKTRSKNTNRSVELQPPQCKRMNVMYPAQTYLNQKTFAFLCWDEDEMKLAGSWCHQHHLYVLKWTTDKGFALLQEKGRDVFAFKYRIKWNAYSQCGTSFWLPIWRKRAGKSRPYPPKLSLLLFFLFVIEANEGQVLEISVEPWMSQWWLSLRLMHLIYLFGYQRRDSAAGWEFLVL